MQLPVGARWDINIAPASSPVFSSSVAAAAHAHLPILNENSMLACSSQWADGTRTLHEMSPSQDLVFPPIDQDQPSPILLTRLWIASPLC